MSVQNSMYSTGETLVQERSESGGVYASLFDHHIAELDFQIGRQLDVVMHHEAFQQVGSAWCCIKSLVDGTDFRQNVKIEVLDASKAFVAAHVPFIGAVGPKFFRDSDYSRCIGLTRPRRLPYGPNAIPVRSFNYAEEVKGPDHENICGPTHLSRSPLTW